MSEIQKVRNAISEKVDQLLEATEITTSDFLGEKVTVIPAAASQFVVQAFGETFGRLDRGQIAKELKSAAWLWIKERLDSPAEALEVL